MKLGPKISVIVNIYNEDNFLDKCIQSLLNQTFSQLEIILVDDGSTDRSAAICKKYQMQNQNIRCVLKENEGLVRSRKRGIQLATGDYVAFIDGDDWVEADWYETLYQAAVKSGADIVIAGHKEDLCGSLIERKNIISAGCYHDESLCDAVYSTMLNTGEFSRFGIFTYLWNKLFRRDIIQATLMKVDDQIFIGEDACTVYPAILRANCIQIITACGYHYRQRVNSMVKVSYDYDLELDRLKRLAQYLNESFSLSPFYYLLYPQLQQFMLSQVAVRTDGFYPQKETERFFFPFPSIKPGDSILLYGAGTFGQHLYRRILSSNSYDLKGWYDERAAQYRTLGLSVEQLQDTLPSAHAKVIVAFIDEFVCNKQREKLIRWGVSCKNIATMQLTTEIKRHIFKMLCLQ